ncbi:MAG TPA: hypothetical protein VIW80_22975 [Pyrinomonadaceae bacterium]
MSSEADTLPTLQTVLDEMRAGFASVNQRLDRVESRVSAIEHQLEQMDIRADRLEGYVNKALSELFNLRADFKEFKSQFNQPA